MKHIKNNSKIVLTKRGYLSLIVLLPLLSCQKEQHGGAIQCFTNDAISISASSFDLSGSVKYIGDNTSYANVGFTIRKTKGERMVLLKAGHGLEQDKSLP